MTNCTPPRIGLVGVGVVLFLIGFAWLVARVRGASEADIDPEDFTKDR